METKPKPDKELLMEGIVQTAKLFDATEELFYEALVELTKKVGDVLVPPPPSYQGSSVSVGNDGK